MDPEVIQNILYTIGVQRMRISGRNIIAECPFGVEHKNGRDSVPSLTIDIERTIWSCFGCGRKGASLRGLVYQWCDRFGHDYNYYRRILFSDQDIDKLERDVDLVKNSRYEDGIKKISDNNDNNNKNKEKEYDIDISEYVQYLRDNAGSIPKYVIKRGVSLEVARECQLGYDKKYKRVLFPIRSMSNGDIVGGMSRGITEKPNYIFNKGLRKNVLYLEYETSIMPLNAPLVVVEGAFDALVLRTYGYNGVAVLGSFITDEQMIKAMMLCDRIYEKYQSAKIVVMFDADQPGRNAGEEVARCLCVKARGIFPVYIASLEKGDPSDATKDEIQKCIDNAKIVCINNINKTKGEENEK